MAMAPSEPVPSARSVTGTRRRDACLLLVLASTVVGTCGLLVVYSDLPKPKQLPRSDVGPSSHWWEPPVVALLLAAAARFGLRAADDTTAMGPASLLRQAEVAADDFLFVPVRSDVADCFRAAFAAALAVMFRAGWRPPATRSASRMLWKAFLSPAWWRFTLVALLVWGAPAPILLRGRTRRLRLLLLRLRRVQRWAGWLALALLLPRAFTRGLRTSRSVLLSSLLSFNLLPLGGQGAEEGPDSSNSGNGSKLPAASASEAPSPMWPLLLVRLQLSVLYLVNAVAKTKPLYLRGDILIAMSQTMGNFLVDLSDGYLDTADMFPFPAPAHARVPVWLCACATVAAEYALGLLPWHPRLKWHAAALGVAFHLSLRLVVRIGWLDWACMFLYLSFLLPFEGRTLPSPLPRRKTRFVS